MADMNATDLMLFFTPSVPQQDLHWGENSGPTLNFPLPPPQTHWADKLTVGAFVFFLKGTLMCFVHQKKEIEIIFIRYVAIVTNITSGCAMYLIKIAPRVEHSLPCLHHHEAECKCAYIFCFFFAFFEVGRICFFVFFSCCVFFYICWEILWIYKYFSLWTLLSTETNFFVDFFWHFGCFFWPTNNISLNQHVSKF